MSIFINYRKDDSRWNTQALYSGLQKYFPKEAIFKDFNNIQPGDDFVDSINKALEQCKVLLVIISKDWLNAKSADGSNRLSDSEDFVRIEIATALKRKIRVIPVLFDNIEMPKAALLPEELHSLTRRQFISISDIRFDNDLQKLAEAIRRPEKEESVLKSITFDTAPAPIQVKLPVTPSNRSRAIAALKIGIPAAIVPMLSLLVYPVNDEKWFSDSLSGAISASLGMSGLPWSIIGAIAAGDRKKWALVIIISFLVSVSFLILLLASMEEKLDTFLSALISLYVALACLAVLFFAWVYKKIAS